MTTPTNNNIPSNSVQDRLYNAEKFDEFMNSDNPNYTDRKGTKRWTLNGIRQAIVNWMDGFSSDVGAANIGTETGQNLSDRLSGLGVVFKSVSDFIYSPVSPDKITVRGFYNDGDGGNGTWVKTGVLDQSKKSSHLPNQAKIYNSVGAEYVLSLDAIIEIDAKANGAKGVNNLTDNEFVCINQVLNGISTVFGYQWCDSGYSVLTQGKTYKTIKILVTASPYGSFYRIGKETFNLKGGMSLDYGLSVMRLSPHPDFTYKKTGERIHAISTKDFVSYFRNQSTSWDLASFANSTISGGIFIGDHAPAVSRDDATAGLGLFIINPKHINISQVECRGFLTGGVFREWNARFTNDKHIHSAADYVLERDDDKDVQQGHFYGVKLNNCLFSGNRDCEVINMCDWSSIDTCKINNERAWILGVDAVAPKHLLINTGSCFSLTGGEVSVYHDNYTSATSPYYPYTYAPQKSTIFDAAKLSGYAAHYSEWNKCKFEIDNVGYTYSTGDGDDLSTTQRYSGLTIEHDTNYKPDGKNSFLLRFADGYFGSFSGDDYAGWVYTDPTLGFSRGDVPRAIMNMTVGRPVQDDSAFLHGGYDFKYGTYNVGFWGSTVPDVDCLRGTRDKGFLNDNGLMFNTGTLVLPVANPSYDSVICIWYYDHTGNYDPKKVRMNSYSPVSTGQGLLSYISYANNLIDYGNGWKLMVIRNLRPFGYSEEKSYQGQSSILITTDSETPITLKLARAYKGGVPLFPAALPDYIPLTQTNGVWGTMTSSTGMDLTVSSFGGGIFRPGDLIDGWNYLKHDSRWNFIQDLNTYGYPLNRRFVLTSGSAGSYLSTNTFTGTVTSKGTGFTEIDFGANVNKIFLGIPLNISGSTGSVTSGKFNLASRTINPDGTFSTKYIVDGTLGNVGDVLTIDNSLGEYTFQPIRIPSLQVTQWINTDGSLTVKGVSNLAGTIFAGTSRPDGDNTRTSGSSSYRYSASYAVKRMYTGTLGDFYGAGSPEGVLAASIGSTYRRTDGGPGTTFYVKESGTDKTGWVAK